MKTLFKILASWQHGLKFFGISLLLFTSSLLVALWGVSVGSSFLQEFNLGQPPDLATMGEVLGGTLAFAVAFAGAWVAFKIASRANVTVDVQQRRQAFRGMHTTLEKSIGQILAMQLELEALLREVGDYAQQSDNWFDSEWKRSGRRPEDRLEAKNTTKDHTQDKADRVHAQAQKVSKKMQQLLASPLALAVVLAIGRAKNPELKEQDLLTDLGQVPRLLDKLMESLKSSERVRPKDQRWGSPYDCVGNLLPKKLVDLGLGSVLVHKLGNAALVDELSYLCFLTGECKPGPASSEIKEPSLWRALRALAYTPSEAHTALEALFSDKGYKEIRAELFQSDPIKAFVLSGMTNDHQMAQKLGDCQRITESIQQAMKRENAGREVALMLLLKHYDVVEASLEPALKRAERLCNDLPKFGDHSKLVRPHCSRLYKILLNRLYHLCESPWLRRPPFELYQWFHESFLEYKEKVTPEEFSVISLWGYLSLNVDILDARAKLAEIVNLAARSRRADLTDKDAIQERVGRLATLAVSAAAADLLDVDGLKMPQEFFTELQKGLNKQIVDRALGPLSSADEANVGRLLEDAAVIPLQVQLAAQACAAQGGAGEFETWLINQLRSAVTHQMQGVLCLAEVQALGGSGRVESNEKGFTVTCKKLHGVPDFLASSVSIRSEDQTERQVSVEFRLLWFDEAGFATVPHADAQLKLTELMLLCGMLGYRKVDPSENFSGAYCKTVRLGINDLHWLRLVILELKLLGTIYCEMAGEPEARDEEVTHL